MAIDASMCLYQFLVSVRQSEGQHLANEEGETTSHLLGIFYRTVRLVENSIKPVYVFDGKPPVLKGGELEKRLLAKEEAIKQRENIKDEATVEEFLKYEKRTVRVTREQNEEVKHLLELMGIPFVTAPCEAEAQCAELARTGKVFAAASEDMDSLCYEPPYLLRHLTFSEARKIAIDQIEYSKVLEALGMTRETFVDLCILLGCDYCETIKGVGPVTAFKLIKEHGSLDNIVEFAKSNPTKTSLKIPEHWPYAEARQLFLRPEVLSEDQVNLKWKEPDVEGLVAYMVKDKGFNEERIRNGAEKLKKGLKSGVQGRLDTFFKAVPSSNNADKKRNAPNGKKSQSKKAKTT